MPRPNPKLIIAAQRAALARKLVDDQRAFVGRLKAMDQPVHDAEKQLRTYESALAHLKNHERIIREARRANKTEALNKPKRRDTIGDEHAKRGDEDDLS